jgi:hypothetical protein
MTESTGEAEQQPPTEVDNDDNEAIREERLDPDNRPDNVEIDNTQRTFDPAAGRFTDDPEYSEDDRPYAEVEGEAPESDDQDQPEDGDDEGPRHRD